MMFVLFECMWSRAGGSGGTSAEPQTKRLTTLWRRQGGLLRLLRRCQAFWSAPQQNQITLSLFFCFPWRDNGAAGGVCVQCPLSAAPTPHSSNWCFVRPRLASLEPRETAGRNKSNMSSALRSVRVCVSECVMCFTGLKIPVYFHNLLRISLEWTLTTG